ncbi:MAG: OmpA family protein [Myxococcota bacterium]
MLKLPNPVVFALALVAGLVAIAAAPAAHAGDASQLGLEYETVAKGRPPALSFAPSAPIKSLVIDLVDQAGKKQTLRVGPIGVGATKKVPIKQELGTASYKASMLVKWGDGTDDTFTVEFTATRVGELKIDIKTEDVDLDARKLQARITNPASAAELSIYDEDGNLIGSARETYDPPAAPGTNLEVTWDAPDASNDKKVLYMQLKVTDVAGFFVGVKITPFTISIPHDDVHFESGRANIPAAEESKLLATLGLVNDALKKHGTLLQLKLFVAGYTDTVGDKGSNKSLSLARAASIAAWFRAHALKIPIYYWGYGEDVLAKQTPDETEEQANRRAVYILATQTPSGPDVPGGQWKPL